MLNCDMRNLQTSFDGLTQRSTLLVEFDPVDSRGVTCYPGLPVFSSSSLVPVINSMGRMLPCFRLCTRALKRLQHGRKRIRAPFSRGELALQNV